jgi:hypothetical protein
MVRRKCERIAVTVRKELGFIAHAVTINGANGVDDMFCVKPKRGRDPGVTDRAPDARSHFGNLAACGKQIGASDSMNRTIDATTTKQRYIRWVDDRIHAALGDIAKKGVNMVQFKLQSGYRWPQVLAKFLLRLCEHSQGLKE